MLTWFQCGGVCGCGEMCRCRSARTRGLVGGLRQVACKRLRCWVLAQQARGLDVVEVLGLNVVFYGPPISEKRITEMKSIDGSGRGNRWGLFLAPWGPNQSFQANHSLPDPSTSSVGLQFKPTHDWLFGHSPTCPAVLPLRIRVCL